MEEARQNEKEEKGRPIEASFLSLNPFRHLLLCSPLFSVTNILPDTRSLPWAFFHSMVTGN